MNENLVFRQNRKVSSAFIDSQVKMGISQTVLMIQDNLTELFGLMKCDGVTYREKFNVFWVFTKTKVEFMRRPKWTDEISVTTFPVSNTGLRTNVNTVIKDDSGNDMIYANMEACVLSLENHRPVRLGTLTYPDSDFPPPCFSKPFEKFPSDFSEDDFVYEQEIRSQNIDMSGHMNNNEYIKFALNVFDGDFLLTHEVKSLEVHYNGESKEKQSLKVWSKKIDGAFYVMISESGRNVFEMKIDFYE